MNTNNESHRNNNFIYALGLICLLNILSSEVFINESAVKDDPQPICIAADFIQPTYFLI